MISKLAPHSYHSGEMRLQIIHPSEYLLAYHFAVLSGTTSTITCHAFTTIGYCFTISIKKLYHDLNLTNSSNKRLFKHREK
jgi:hypothetical protein